MKDPDDQTAGQTFPHKESLGRTDAGHLANKLDDVAAPEGQGPVTVVWRRYGKRGDRIRIRLQIVIAYCLVYALALLIDHFNDHRWWPGTTYVIWTVALFGTVGWVHQWAQANGHVFMAAGLGWVGWGSTRNGNPSGEPSAWVQIGALNDVKSDVRNQFGSMKRYLNLSDTHGHRVKLNAEWLVSCEPILKLVAASVETQKDHLNIDDRTLDVLARQPRPEGQTILRESAS